MKKNLTIAALTLLTLGGCNKNNEEPSDVYDEGIEINGVVWATRNVDKPGTFAETPYDPGLLYEWNSKVGRTYAEAEEVSVEMLTDWDGTLPVVSLIWEKINDPCPKGWHVPTKVEGASLGGIEFIPTFTVDKRLVFVKSLVPIHDKEFVIANPNGIGDANEHYDFRNDAIFWTSSALSSTWHCRSETNSPCYMWELTTDIAKMYEYSNSDTGIQDEWFMVPRSDEWVAVLDTDGTGAWLFRQAGGVRCVKD
jgi:hypothetical protein